MNYKFLFMDEFLKYKIKEYEYWSVYIYENQGYLGRCVIWCDREDAKDLADMTQKERDEFFIILKNLKKALKTIFNSDWFNYAFLGNGIKHLHRHFIPRYASERKFEEIIFKDEQWGHNYKTDHNFKISEDLIEEIRLKIKEGLD